MHTIEVHGSLECLGVTCVQRTAGVNYRNPHIALPSGASPIYPGCVPGATNIYVVGNFIGFPVATPVWEFWVLGFVRFCKGRLGFRGLEGLGFMG